MAGKVVLVLLLSFFYLEEASSAVVKNTTNSVEEISDQKTTTDLPFSSQENTTQDKAEDVYGKLTGIANKLKKESCKCVSLFDDCGVEMLEETVVRERGKACLTNQRYCCGKEEIKMDVEEESNLKKLMQSSKIEEYQDYKDYENDQADKENQSSVNSILRDEISNMSNINSNETKLKEIDNPNSYIRPSTLGAILRLMTEGFKFMTNFF